MYFLRVVLSTVKYNLISFYRVFAVSSFALRFFMPLLSIGTAWVLYNRVFDGQVSTSFNNLAYTDYLTFVILGNAIFVYIYASVFYTGRALFFSRLEGVLDLLFLSPMSRIAFMIGAAGMGMLNATFDFLVLITVGLAVGMDITSVNYPLCLSGMVITLVSLFGLGLVVNGITLTLRDRVNTANFLQAMLYAFSGVVVPVGMMPKWAQAVSRISPLTYGLHIIRGSFRKGAEFTDFYHDFAMLIIMSVVTFVIGLYALKAIEKNLKKHAKLTVL